MVAGRSDTADRRADGGPVIRSEAGNSNTDSGADLEGCRPMWIGWLHCDLLLGDVHSLKQKRSVVRPLVAELRRRLSVAAAETDSVELHRRAGIGISVVASDREHVVEVLDAAERLVAAHPEFDLLAVKRRMLHGDDVD